ncbi:MAG: transposase, partial [Actinomycetota bacterium]
MIEPKGPNPVVGVDYPGTWRELLAWFPDERACLSYLEHLRWPKGFVCPRCSATEAWLVAGPRWK